MKHHVYVSDNYNAEDVTDFYVESDESPECIVKAIALTAIVDNDLSPDEIESISFDAMKNHYGVLIQCRDHHIMAWMADGIVPVMEIDQNYLELAANIPSDTFYGDEKEIEELLSKINDITEE